MTSSPVQSTVQADQPADANHGGSAATLAMSPMQWLDVALVAVTVPAFVNLADVKRQLRVSSAQGGRPR